MTDQRELDRLLDAYFVVGAEELPDRVIDAALEQIDHTRQRRPIRAPWRFPTMTTPIRIAAAALIGVLAVGGAYYLSQPSRPSVGPPAPTSSASPSAAGPAWITTGAMANARTDFTATLLSNGKVLVVGGSDAANNRKAELYDPATGTWTATGPLSYGRSSFHTATLLKDGKVLVTGAGERDTSAELYDPATGVWTPTGYMAEERGQHVAALLPDGRVLVAGGTSGDGPKAAETYDPATGTWTPTAVMVVWRASPAMAILTDGTVLLAGGFGQGFPLSSTERFDYRTGKWTSGSSMLERRQDDDSATLLRDGRVLVAGGQQSTAELYDPGADTWSATGKMIEGRGGHTATLLPDGTVLLTGGIGPGGSTDALTAAQRYDPATGSWSLTTPMNVARQGARAALLPDGRLLVVGGVSRDGERLSSAELFQPD